MSTYRLSLPVHTLVALIIVLVSACSPQENETGEGQGIPVDNPELKELYDQDQADRSARPDSAAWIAVTHRDSLRRVRVHELLDANLVITSEDFHHAAMVFQHGMDTTSARLAHELARKAVELDSSNASAKWLMAAAWDRYLMRLGKPQWYATQFVRDGPGTLWRLYDTDTTAVTDEDRKKLGVQTLEEARAYVAALNQQEGL